jgi:hypothetical protein
VEGGFVTIPATVIKLSIQRMVCTGCGAEANASCNCGLNYVPKAVRAAEAVKANPEKSNRAIAEETGLSEPTVRRARASSDAPETVTGKDGKQYPANPAKPEVEIEPGKRARPPKTGYVTIDEYLELGARVEKLEARNRVIASAERCRSRDCAGRP